LYNRFSDWRRQLRLLAEFTSDEKNWPPPFERPYGFADGGVSLFDWQVHTQSGPLFPGFTESDVVIDGGGRYELLASPLALAIKGAPARVRLCEICGCVFWAQRKDKWACDGKCSDTRRKRLSRADKQKSKHLYKQSEIERAQLSRRK